MWSRLFRDMEMSVEHTGNDLERITFGAARQPIASNFAAYPPCSGPVFRRVSFLIILQPRKIQPPLQLSSRRQVLRSARGEAL
jgi:hypothetical protein